MDVVTEQTNPNDKSSNAKLTFKLYKERWLVIGIVAILLITNGTIWTSFTSIANMAASYYDTDLTQINWLATVTSVTGCTFSIVAMWTINNYGLKTVIYITGACNFIGCVIRLFGTFDFVSDKYLITMIGQTIATLGTPFVMSTPVYVSQLWFPDHERIYSTAIATVALGLGGALGSLIPPHLTKKPSDLFITNDTFCTIIICASLLVLLIRHSKPLSPPSISASVEVLRDNKTFLMDLKKIFTNKNLVILLLCGSGLMMSVCASFTVILQPLLCSWGYSNVFVGIMTCMSVLGGTIASPLLATLAEKAIIYEEIMKTAFCVGNAFLAALILLMPIPHFEIPIAILMILFGASTIGIQPIVMESGVELGYPVHQGLLGPLFILTANLQTMIVNPLLMQFALPMNNTQKQRETCTVIGLTHTYNMTYAGIFILAVNSLECVVLTIFCRIKYNRRNAEKVKLHVNVIEKEPHPSQSQLNLQILN